MLFLSLAAVAGLALLAVEAAPRGLRSKHFNTRGVLARHMRDHASGRYGEQRTPHHIREPDSLAAPVARSVNASDEAAVPAEPANGIQDLSVGVPAPVDVPAPNVPAPDQVQVTDIADCPPPKVIISTLIVDVTVYVTAPAAPAMTDEAFVEAAVKAIGPAPLLSSPSSSSSSSSETLMLAPAVTELCDDDDVDDNLNAADAFPVKLGPNDGIDSSDEPEDPLDREDDHDDSLADEDCDITTTTTSVAAIAAAVATSTAPAAPIPVTSTITVEQTNALVPELPTAEPLAPPFVPGPEIPVPTLEATILEPTPTEPCDEDELFEVTPTPEAGGLIDVDILGSDNDDDDDSGPADGLDLDLPILGA